MKLNTQKTLASKVMKGVGRKRVKLVFDRFDEIKESITKADIRGLIKDGAIIINQKGGSSRGRIRKMRLQKSKGLRKGRGSRKGRLTARTPAKREWINKVRKQRKFIKLLRDNKIVTSQTYQLLYSKVKGGFFRSRRHLKLYIDEQDLAEKKLEHKPEQK